MNIPKLSLNLDEYSVGLFDKIINNLIDYCYLLIKHDISKLRKIETKNIENYTPFARILIREQHIFLK